MDYELAKQLKDAGFPQTIGGRYQTETSLLFPTLEAVIEACGTLDLKIRQDSTEVRKLHVGKWSGGLLKIKGTTPTEAVARLWLALHAKK
jgi:hypothetical protein